MLLDESIKSTNNYSIRALFVFYKYPPSIWPLQGAGTGVTQLCSGQVQQLGWNKLIMQIVSEALFERLKQAPLLYTATHNRIAFVTPSHLTIRQIALQGKSYHLKLRGNEVAAISMENSNFIVVVFVGGVVEVRKIDVLGEVVVSCQVQLGKEGSARVRVSSQAVYILGRDSIESIGLMKQKGRRRIQLQEAREQPKDLLISSIFEQQIVLVQYPSSIALTTEGKNIAEAPFEGVNAFKLLKDPLLLSTDSKQFLVLVEGRKYLKVFDIFDLDPIIEMEVFLEEDEEVQLKIDPLHEYLLMRYFVAEKKETTRNNLLRINRDFYRGQAKQPFFLFDIEIALKEDFILFPTHIELIKGAEFYSIDMCFFTQKEIRIATLVVDVNHRTKLSNTNYVNSSWMSHSSWKDFFYKREESEGQGEIEFREKQDDWQIFLERFYQENLQKLKCQGLYKINKQGKDMFQYEDALNTLSGSSSFGSLKEIPSKLALPFRTLEEGQNLSSEGEEWRSKQKGQKNNESEDDSNDEYLTMVQEEVLGVLSPIDDKIDEIDCRIDRIQNIHGTKLKNMSRNIKRHQKQTKNLDKNIEKWCGEEFDLFGSELKETLRDYSSMIGRLEIAELRSVKKLKKHYRDCLEVQIERCYQKLEEGEKTVKDIQRIANKHSKR